jgi:hypothetical protein
LETPASDLSLPVLQELPEIADECLIPCWLGLKLNDTDVAEFTQAIFTYLDPDVSVDPLHLSDGRISYSLGFDLSEEAVEDRSSRSILIYVYFRDDHLDQVTIQLPLVEQEQHLWDEYAPVNVLNMYGVPSQILLTPGPSYSIWFIYEDINAALRYTAYHESVEDGSEDGQEYCFTLDKLNSISLNIYSNYYNSVYSLTSDLRSLNKSLEETTEITNDQLLAYLLANQNGCIHIPFQVWVN